MRAVVERVSYAKICANGADMGSGKTGLLVFLGIGENDTEKDVPVLANKISKLRIFEDESHKMGRSLSDVNGTLYIVSNFTLYGDCKKGNRPDFFKAAPPQRAHELYDLFIEFIKPLVPNLICGIFGADMQITTNCDGPVTLIIESETLKGTNL